MKGAGLTDAEIAALADAATATNKAVNDPGARGRRGLWRYARHARPRQSRG